MERGNKEVPADWAIFCTHLEWGLHPDLNLEGFDESVSGLTCRNWVRVANDVAQEICRH